MPNITVANLTANPISCDVGLVPANSSLTVPMGPAQAYRASEGLKSLADLGRIRVTLSEESAKLDELELAPGLIQFVDVTIPTASILTLNATPFTLVAAPGVGKVLIFEGAICTMKYNSAAYAGIAAGEDLAIKYTGAAGLEVGEIETTGFLDQTADQMRYCRPHNAASAISSIVAVANVPLVAHMLSGEITTGNSDLKLRVFHRVLPILIP